jgi:hypothetical protein
VKYWIDTEFIARPCTIDLISIGLVAEDERELYAESSEIDRSKANAWTLENVRPQLEGKGMSREEIGYAVRQFTNGDQHPEFWGYFSAHDWVAFTWLFGGIDELPFHYPQLCLDIKQWAIGLGDPPCSTPAGQKPPGRFSRGSTPQVAGIRKARIAPQPPPSPLAAQNEALLRPCNSGTGYYQRVPKGKLCRGWPSTAERSWCRIDAPSAQWWLFGSWIAPAPFIGPGASCCTQDHRGELARCVRTRL